MNTDWKTLPGLALRIIVLAVLTWGVAIGLLNFMATGDVQALLITFVLTVGASAVVPVALFIYRVWYYFIFVIFWYLVVVIAVLSMVVGAMFIIAAPGGHALALVGATIVGLVWLFISRKKSETPEEWAVRYTVEEARAERQRRAVRRPSDEPEPEHPTKPRRPSPPPGRPDPDRINKELAERKRRMGTN